MHKDIEKHQVLLETVGSTGQINCGVHKLAPEDGESFSAVEDQHLTAFRASFRENRLKIITESTFK